MFKYDSHRDVKQAILARAMGKMNGATWDNVEDRITDLIDAANTQVETKQRVADERAQAAAANRAAADRDADNEFGGLKRQYLGGLGRRKYASRKARSSRKAQKKCRNFRRNGKSH